MISFENHLVELVLDAAVLQVHRGVGHDVWRHQATVLVLSHVLQRFSGPVFGCWQNDSDIAKINKINLMTATLLQLNKRNFMTILQLFANLYFL